MSLSVVAVTSQSVTLVWTPPTRTNGVIQRYTITASSVTVNNTTTSVGLVLTYVVTNLVPYTNYTFTISACTGAGCQAAPSIWKITNEAQPAGMGVLSFSDINSTSLNVSWSPPAFPNGLYGSSY